MKVSEILKKVGSIGAAEIQIVFREDRGEVAHDTAFLNGDTPEELADQVIRRAAEYTLQEMDLFQNILTIYAIRTPKRERKPKPEPETRDQERDQAVEGFKRSVAELKQAVAELVQEIVAAFHPEPAGENVDKLDGGQQSQGKKGKNAIRRARAAVARILTRLFRKGGADHA